MSCILLAAFAIVAQADAPQESGPGVIDVEALGQRVLYAKRPRQRRDAVVSLGDAPGQDALPFLIAATMDANGDVSAAAIEALGQHREDASFITPILVKLLDTRKHRTVSYAPDSSGLRPVRYDVARSLGKLGPGAKLAAPALMRRAAIGQEAAQAASDDMDPDEQLVQIQCALSYGLITGEHDAATEVLVGYADHKSRMVRAEATKALGEIKPMLPAVVDELVNLASSDEDSLVRVYAIKGLEGAPQGRVDVRACLEAALDDMIFYVRGDAAVVLAKRGGNPPGFLNNLLEAQKGSEGSYLLARDLARAMMLSVGSTEALKFLQSEYESTEGLREKLGVARIISNIETEEARDVLEAVAAHAEGDLRSGLHQIQIDATEFQKSE